MIKLIKEMKEMAEFYELKFTSVLSTWVFRPKDYLQMKLEMIKYKLVVSSRWENV